jgi:hypothetical protein
MRVIIAHKGTNITYEHIASISDKDEELLLIGSEDDYIRIIFNGWLIAKVLRCRVEKRCLVSVDEVFLDTRVEGV